MSVVSSFEISHLLLKWFHSQFIEPLNRRHFKAVMAYSLWLSDLPKATVENLFKSKPPYDINLYWERR